MVLTTAPVARHIAAVLATATEPEVTAALYRSPDFGHGGPLDVLELVELWAVQQLDTGRSHLHAGADRARVALCRDTARAVLAAQ